jgi:hypothetical protein
MGNRRGQWRFQVALDHGVLGADLPLLHLIGTPHDGSEMVKECEMSVAA